MKKRTLPKILTSALIASFLISSLGVYAKDYTNDDVTGAEVKVKADVGSTFTVGIPTSVILNPQTGTGNFNISIKGDLDAAYRLIVAPTDKYASKDGVNILLKDNKASGDRKNNIIVDITQSKTEFFYNEINPVTPITQNVVLQADSEITAGQWESVLEYNISLKRNPLNAGIYDAEGNLYQELTLANAKSDASGVNDLITQPGSEVVLPVGVTSIKESAFVANHNIVSIQIPNGVTSIGNFAFNSCNNLVTVDIPDSVESIGMYTFSQCTALKDVNLPNNNNFTEIEEYVFESSSIKHLIIPNSVTTIKERAFQYSSIEAITIPDSVTTIGTGAFDNASLVAITIPNNVTSIGSYAFRGTSLNSVVLEEGIEGNFGGHSIFSNCTNLKSVTLPSTLKTIGTSMFAGTGLTSITIPNGVTSIKDYAFQGCTSLTTVNLPNTLTSIGTYAFQNCTSLNGIIIPEGVTTIEDYTFQYCSAMTTVSIPESVTEIKMAAFHKCTAIETINIPSGVTTIGNGAFSNLTSMTSITVPDGVLSIGTSAFSKVPHIEYHGSATGSPWNALSIN